VWRWLEAGLWTLVLTLFWCATATSLTAVEVGLAVAGGAMCGVSAVLAREAYRGRWRVRARWAGWLRLLPGALLTDSVRVARAAVGRGDGELRTVPLPGGAAAAEQDGRRALAGLLISITPGGYLVDAPPDRTGLVLHVLGPPTGLERAVRR
jgi:multisubunit Na+/H+ antiporter MnhE subunit